MQDFLVSTVVSPLITPIVVPYIIPYIAPFKEFRLSLMCTRTSHESTSGITGLGFRSQGFLID